MKNATTAPILKAEPTECKTCGRAKPVTGWKLHARFPDDVFCSRICVDTAGAGSDPTEPLTSAESAVPGPNIGFAGFAQPVQPVRPVQPVAVVESESARVSLQPRLFGDDDQ